MLKRTYAYNDRRVIRGGVRGSIAGINVIVVGFLSIVQSQDWA